jgi:hypothetical protein
MRKLVLSALLLATFTGVFAQKLDDVREKIEKGKFDEAREKIDKVLADSKNQGSSDAWLYKAQIYTELSKNNTLDTVLSSAAYEALKRYISLEESKDASKRFMMSKLQGHSTFFNVYSTYFKQGAEAFNAKNFPQAYTSFSRAVEAFDILRKYEMTEVKFDTTSVLYAGVAAESAKMPEDAVRYYSQIAALKIPDTTYMGVYGYLTNYYMGKKDLANANRYIDLGESVFPNRDVWMVYRLETVGADTVARLRKYEELLAKNPDYMMLANDYAVEMYRYVYYSDARANDTAWMNKLRNAFRGAARVNPTVTNNYIMMSILADDINFMTNSISRIKTSTKPDDVKKRQAIQASLDKANEEMIVYALKAADQYSALGTGIKTADKANYRRTLQNIADYYRSKNQADKAATYEQKMKQL